MKLRALMAIAAFQLASGGAHACLFANSTKPEGWYQWANALYGGEVTHVEPDREKPIDVVTVRVLETFKGQDATHGTLTVRLSNRYWTNCKVERPVAGAQVLVAINPNNDAMLVSLSAGYAEQLRQLRVTQPRPY